MDRHIPQQTLEQSGSPSGAHGVQGARAMLPGKCGLLGCEPGFPLLSPSDGRVALGLMG